MSSITEQLSPKPFVKWVGGKRSILHEILPRLPKKFRGYYEPFVGGGALYFALVDTLGKSTLVDLNQELILSYRAIKHSPRELIKSLQQHARNHSEEYYYYQRGRKPRSYIETASRFIYLNKTCFNGLYRVNKKGVFNTPLGAYKNPNIVQTDTLLSCSESFKNVTIQCGDFESIDPKRGDFVYFDPPYYPIDGTSFTEYSKEDFTAADQERLHNFALRLRSKGVHVMLSNSKTIFIKKLYKENIFKKHIIQAPRFVNSKADGRRKVDEFLITTY